MAVAFLKNQNKFSSEVYGFSVLLSAFTFLRNRSIKASSNQYHRLHSRLLSMKQSKPKICIGRRELAELPLLNTGWIEVKIDTGAYTCALHCSDIKTHKTQQGDFVEFRLFDATHPSFEQKWHRLPIAKHKIIRSSNGETDHRIIIRTVIRLAGLEFVTDFSLTDRSAMRYPVLLGRKALKRRFLVDVDRLHTNGRPQQIKSQNN
jgi:hypothetical protein